MARDENYIQDIIDPEEVTRNIGKVHRLDERTMLKQKYPGVTDDLLEKILMWLIFRLDSNAFITFSTYLSIPPFPPCAPFVNIEIFINLIFI